LPRLKRGPKHFSWRYLLPLLFLTVLGLLWWFWPQAVVTLRVSPQFLEESFTVKVVPGAALSVEEGVIPGEEVAITVEGKKSAATSGEKEVGEKAAGEVTIYNRTEVEETLEKGTKLIAPGDLEFEIVDYGLLEKNETAQEIAMDIIRGLSTPERLDFLFDRYERLTGEDEEQKDVGRLLAHLGEGSLARLMDILREHTNSDERVKVLHLFIEIGRPVLAIIKNEIHLDRPWYFHRNLAYLLGWIKGETNVESLRALLLHKHDKVRKEALASLAKVGGEERGPVLLETLPAVDGAFKLELIDRLGRMKCREATPVFLAMMKERPFIVTPARIDLEEALCTALGRIGNPAAFPVLNEISNPGFFTVTTYHKKVKIAASRALTFIGKN